MTWALLISLVSLALGIYNAVHGVRIDTARIRTDVMTRLYGVQVGYEQFLRRIRDLKNWPPKPLPDELEWLIASEQAYVGFLNNTAQYRQTLLGPKRISRTDLQNVTDDLEAMFPVKQVKLRAGGERLRAYEGIRFSDEMLPRVYQVANADLVDLGFGFEALRCDDHGWPIPRILEADDFSV